MGCYFQGYVTKGYGCHLALLFVRFDEDSCYVVSCPVERSTWQGTKKDLWTTVH